MCSLFCGVILSGALARIIRPASCAGRASVKSKDLLLFLTLLRVLRAVVKKRPTPNPLPSTWPHPLLPSAVPPRPADTPSPSTRDIHPAVAAHFGFQAFSVAAPHGRSWPHSVKYRTARSRRHARSRYFAPVALPEKSSVLPVTFAGPAADQADAASR